jgi:Zn-dependent protease
MALAGPAANLALVLAAALAVRAGMALGVYQAPERISFHSITSAAGPGFAAAAITPLSILFSLNLILCVFNLLPAPPLDGSAAIAIFMSDDTARRYQAFLRQPMFSLLGILVAWQLFDPIFQPINLLALNLLYPGAGYR